MAWTRDNTQEFAQPLDGCNKAEVIVATNVTADLGSDTMYIFTRPQTSGQVSCVISFGNGPAVTDIEYVDEVTLFARSKIGQNYKRSSFRKRATTGIPHQVRNQGNN